MRIDWIEDVVALLDHGGVAEAARRRNVTQPAFSRRIRVLEEVLGFEVIDRSVKPSGPSHIVLNHEAELRKLATEQRLLLSEMRQQQTSGARRLVIASQHAITTSLGPEIIKIAGEPGKTHIRLRSANFDECEALLMTRQATISLTYRILSEGAPELPSFLAEAAVGADTLLPVCSAAQAREHMWRFHHGELRVIGYPADVFLGAALSRHVLPALANKCQVSVVTETALTTAALQLSQSGLGVAWVPGALARAALDRGDLVDLRDELGWIDMALIARRWAATATTVTLDAWQKLIDRPDQHALSRDIQDHEIPLTP